MPAGFSNYAEDKILDHALGDGAWTSPSALYLGLWTASTTLDDTSTGATSGEAAYTGYARQQVLAASLNASSGGSKTNGTAIVFAACTGGTSTITQWAIVDSSSGAGNIIVWGTCTSTVISTTQTPATVGVGGLVVTLD